MLCWPLSCSSITSFQFDQSQRRKGSVSICPDESEHGVFLESVKGKPHKPRRRWDLRTTRGNGVDCDFQESFGGNFFDWLPLKWGCVASGHCGRIFILNRWSHQKRMIRLIFVQCSNLRMNGCGFWWNSCCATRVVIMYRLWRAFHSTMVLYL